MIQFSSSLKLNEIHKVDSPFKRGSQKYIFSREALSSGEGQWENVGKWAITGASIVIQIGGWSISKENISS